MTATPDVIRERLLPGDEFMILASDGLVSALGCVHVVGGMPQRARCAWTAPAAARTTPAPLHAWRSRTHLLPTHLPPLCLQWDVLSDSEACAIVRRHLQQSGAPRQITPPQLLHGAAAFGGAAFAEQMRRPPVLTAALATAAAERLVQVRTSLLAGQALRSACSAPSACWWRACPHLSHLRLRPPPTDAGCAGQRHDGQLHSCRGPAAVGLSSRARWRVHYRGRAAAAS